MFESAPAPTFATRLAAVTAAVDQLAATDPHRDPGPDLAARTGQLWALIERLTGMHYRRLAALEADGRWALDGSATFTAWVAAATGQPQPAAAGVVRTARILDTHLPQLGAALIDGGTGLDAVRVVTKIGASTPTRRSALAAADALLTDFARSFPLPDLTQLMHRWADTVDADGVLRDADATYRDRYLLLSNNLDGSLTLDARLDPESGAIVRTWLDAMTGPATWTAADTPPPDHPARSSDTGDARSMPQRRADALVDLARQALDHGRTPLHGGVRPRLLITTTDSRLHRAVCAGTGTGTGTGTDTDTSTGTGTATTKGTSSCGPDRPPAGPVTARTITAASLTDPGTAPAVLYGAGPLTAPDLARLACDATITAALLSPGGEPLVLGRARRAVTPALRTALILRDGGCTWPGCHRPWTWTDAHHIRHWANGGTTDLDNLILVCRTHHRHLHRHHLTPVRGGDPDRTAGDPGDPGGGSGPPTRPGDPTRSLDAPTPRTAGQYHRAHWEFRPAPGWPA